MYTHRKVIQIFKTTIPNSPELDDSKLEVIIRKSGRHHGFYTLLLIYRRGVKRKMFLKSVTRTSLSLRDLCKLPKSCYLRVGMKNISKQRMAVNAARG